MEEKCKHICEECKEPSIKELLQHRLPDSIEEVWQCHNLDCETNYFSSEARLKRAGFVKGMPRDGVIVTARYAPEDDANGMPTIEFIVRSKTVDNLHQGDKTELTQDINLWQRHLQPGILK